MHPDYYRLDPKRPPSWRFDRILQLLEDEDNPRLPKRGDDKFVRTFYKFLKDYNRAVAVGTAAIAGTNRSLDDTPEFGRLFARKPYLWYAYQLHTDSDTEWRALIQARILARETDEQIAKQFGTMAEVITWYERLFFDVRDRLNCYGWIVKTIFGAWVHRNAEPRTSGAITEAQRDLLYSIFAYCGGSHALDSLTSGFRMNVKPMRAGDVEHWYEQSIKHLVKVKATAAMQIMEVNKYNVMQLFDLCFRVMETEKVAGNDEKRKSVLEEAFTDLIEEIPWELNLRSVETSSPQQRKLLTGPVEARASEQLIIASGQAVPDLLEYSQQVEEELSNNNWRE